MKKNIQILIGLILIQFLSMSAFAKANIEARFFSVLSSASLSVVEGKHDEALSHLSIVLEMLPEQNFQSKTTQGMLLKALDIASQSASALDESQKSKLRDRFAQINQEDMSLAILAFDASQPGKLNLIKDVVTR